jgi:hypothetical protein
MHVSTAKRKITHMSKDKDDRTGPQFLSRGFRNLTQNPIWRQQQEAIAKLRERLRLPQYAQLKTPRLSADPLAEAIERQARAEAEQLEPPPDIERPVAPVEEASPAVAEKSTVETAAPSSEPALPKRKPPKQWAAEWMKANPQREDEDDTAYAQRMCDDMAKATDVEKAWPFRTCRRELYREPTEDDFAPDPDSVQTFPKHH